MSADQLRRAAERAPHYAADPVRRDLAMAALLATAAGHWSLTHSVLTDCRLHEGDCLVCLLDDVAAAYLGEEPQP